MTSEPNGVAGSGEAGRAPLADIAQRSIARIIDSGIVMFVLLAILIVPGMEENRILAGVVSMTFLALYETVPVALTGATFGKRVMSIGVVMARDGRRPPWINAFLRVAPAIPVMVLSGQFFMVALPFLYSIAGFVESRRGLVDKIAGTAVIKVA